MIANQDLSDREFSGCGSLDTESKTRVLRTMEELEEFRSVWNRWCTDPNADLEYFLASARCRTDFVRPHIIVVYQLGRPDCMLIGRLEHTQISLKIGYFNLFRPKTRRLFFVQGGLLGNASQENCHLMAQTIKKNLNDDEADSAEVSRLTAKSCMHAAVMTSFGFLCSGHFSPLHEHRWIELPTSFSAFMRGLSRKNRHEIRRHEKRLLVDFEGKTRIHCYRAESEVDKLAMEVEKICANTYQRALGVGFRSDPENLESLRVAARGGGLRGCVLYVDEKPCSFFIGKQYKGAFYGHFMGFDPEFQKYSPGLLVLMHSIEECFDPTMRATKFDFGWGDRQYKRAVSNQTCQDGPVYLYALSFSGLRLNVVRSFTAFLDQVSRKCLSKVGVFRKLQRAWQDKLIKTHTKAYSDQKALLD